MFYREQQEEQEQQQQNKMEEFKNKLDKYSNICFIGGGIPGDYKNKCHVGKTTFIKELLESDITGEKNEEHILLKNTLGVEAHPLNSGNTVVYDFGSTYLDKDKDMNMFKNLLQAADKVFIVHRGDIGKDYIEYWKKMSPQNHGIVTVLDVENK